MLYLVSTPIGNLADITLRALEVLKSCDYILCEDTRHSSILLKHYDIHKGLKSYHKFNELSQASSILNDLQAGKKICLISDAGTPGISDPGTDLVKLCIEHQIPVMAIPGPCAAIQAVCCSGFPTDHFQFWGFLPKKEGELKQALLSMFSYEGTTICYESPNRIMNTLSLIDGLQPLRELVIARELTKAFEEFIRGTASFLLNHFNQHQPKGEMVLLISPPKESEQPNWENWTPEEHVQWMQEHYSLTKQEAIKLVAKLRQVPKRQIYNQLLQKDE